MKVFNQTIQETVDSHLCTGCGTCAGICQNSAIHMTKTNSAYVPELDRNACGNCGVCLGVCPGQSVDFEKMNIAIFGKKCTEPLIGNYINCYIGHSVNLDVRKNSSSGGLVTELLLFALDNGLIDGALVTKMDTCRPLNPQVFIAKTRDQIIDASRSKYCPVPANVALKQLLNENGRFAVVGLPCHIEGIRKAEIVNAELNKKIAFHMGLICNHAPTFLATTYLLEKLKINEADLVKIDYRGEGWPGQMSLKLKNGKTKHISQFDPYYWGHVFNFYFFTQRCLLCNDKVCELSDMSFGDAWHKSDSRIGESIIISRNKLSEELLHKAIDSGRIRLKKVNSIDVSESQALSKTKRRFKARSSVFRKFGKNIPIYNQSGLQPKPSDYIDALMSYSRLYISKKPQLWKLIDVYPALRKIAKNTIVK